MFDDLNLGNININDMMKKMQDAATKAKVNDANNIFTSKVGGGMIELSINGNNEVVDLQIDDALLQDKDSLKILLISSINDCIKKSDDNKKSLAMNIMDQFNINGK